MARDIAHAKIKERLDLGKACRITSKTIQCITRVRPKRRRAMLRDPSVPPPQRMDAYVDLFQSHGGSMVMG